MLLRASTVALILSIPLLNAVAVIRTLRTDCVVGAERSPQLQDQQWNLTMTHLDRSLSRENSTNDLISVISNVRPIKSAHYPLKLSPSHRQYLDEFWKCILNRAQLRGSSLEEILNLFTNIRHQNSMLNLSMNVSVWNEFMKIAYQSRRYSAPEDIKHYIFMM